MSNPKLSAYEKIRLDNISDRANDWQKLLDSKAEFDDHNEKKSEKKSAKKGKKNTGDGSLILRKSSRNKLKINYKEDSITGSGINILTTLT